MTKPRAVLLIVIIIVVFSSFLAVTETNKTQVAIVVFSQDGTLLSDVSVYLDKKLKGKTTSDGFLKFEVKPEKHELTVKKTGYKNKTKIVNVEEGELKQVRIELKKVKYQKNNGNEKPKKLEENAQKKVLFDEGHKEWIKTSNSQVLVGALEGEGFSVQAIERNITSHEVLSGHDVFIIGNAWNKFDPSEVQTIKDYYKKGGGILLLGLGWSWKDYHAGKKYPMNEIAKLFNASFNADMIMDPTNHTTKKSSAIFHRPFISSHSITEGVAKLGARENYHGSIHTSSSWNLLIMGDKDSYSNYHESPYPEGSNPPVLAIKKDLKTGGKVAILSSGDYLNDEHIEEFDNKQLALNLIEWLSQ